jgi:hypothetical protein
MAKNSISVLLAGNDVGTAPNCFAGRKAEDVLVNSPPPIGMHAG